MLTGIVLCGGAGRRFQGQDKPLLELQGRSLLAHVTERLLPQVDQLIISANRHRSCYEAYGFPVVSDDETDLGPLAGISAAARHSRSDLLFVCPGDCPLIPRDLVAGLLPLLTADRDAVVPHDGQRTQHLFLLLRRDRAMRLPEYLEAGGRSVHEWLQSLRLATLEVPAPDAFININSPAELAGLETQLAARTTAERVKLQSGPIP